MAFFPKKGYIYVSSEKKKKMRSYTQTFHILLMANLVTIYGFNDGQKVEGADKRLDECIKICCLQYKSPISAMAKSKGRVSIVKTSLAKQRGKESRSHDSSSQTEWLCSWKMTASSEKLFKSFSPNFLAGRVLEFFHWKKGA